MSSKEITKLTDENVRDNEVILDVCISVNGINIDLQSFIDHWESQVDRLINEKATQKI